MTAATIHADISSARQAKGAWLMVALLFLFMVVNFADKAVIGIAAVPIMQELQITPSQFGLIGSSFFLLFALSAIVTGFVVNRVQTRWALLAMGLVWALTQFPMMGAAGFGTIVACRIALGAGEGPAVPVALHSAYKWFPNELRTLPTAVIVQGGAVGIMVALPLLNWVIVHYSWHWAFGALGIAGLLWTAAWLVFGREGSLVSRDRSRYQTDARSGQLRKIGVQPHDFGELVRGFWGQLGLVASAVLARGISDQGTWLCAGLDRPIGCATARCQRGRYDRCRLVFAAPPRPRATEPRSARHPGRRLRRAGRSGAGAHAIRAGHPR